MERLRVKGWFIEIMTLFQRTTAVENSIEKCSVTDAVVLYIPL